MSDIKPNKLIPQKLRGINPMVLSAPWAESVPKHCKITRIGLKGQFNIFINDENIHEKINKR